MGQIDVTLRVLLANGPSAMTMGLWGRVRSSTTSWLVISAFFIALDVVDGAPYVSWSAIPVVVFMLWPLYFAVRWVTRGF